MSRWSSDNNLLFVRLKIRCRDISNTMDGLNLRTLNKFRNQFRMQQGTRLELGKLLENKMRFTMWISLGFMLPCVSVVEDLDSTYSELRSCWKNIYVLSAKKERER